MNLGLVFLESIYTSGLTKEEIQWIARHQSSFSRTEEATAIKLGRLVDRGLIHLGCGI